MRLNRLVGLVLTVFSLNDQAFAGPFRSVRLNCSEALQAIKLADGESKSVPVLAIERSMIRNFDGATHIILVSDRLNDDASKHTLLYIPVGPSMPNSPKQAGLNKIRITDIDEQTFSDLMRDIFQRGLLTMTTEVERSSEIIKPKVSNSELRYGTLLRSQKGEFRVVVWGASNRGIVKPQHEANFFDTFDFKTIPAVGTIGTRGNVIAGYDDLTGYVIAGKVAVNWDGKVLETDLLDPLPGAPREIKVDRSNLTLKFTDFVDTFIHEPGK